MAVGGHFTTGPFPRRLTFFPGEIGSSVVHFTAAARLPPWSRSPDNGASTMRNNTAPTPGVQFSKVDPSGPLVPHDNAAQDLTRKVDANVRTYKTLNGTGIGFARLHSSAGLHCSVMNGGVHKSIVEMVGESI